jgi:hypothetical protein
MKVVVELGQLGPSSLHSVYRNKEIKMSGGAHEVFVGIKEMFLV